MGELDESELQAAQTLVRSAFGAGFRSHDWLHALGGVHVVVTEGGTLVAHAAVVARNLWHDGGILSTGYVEGVAVRPDRQGGGLGGIVMERAESLIDARHAIGALNAVKAASDFYTRRGWRLWDGPTRARAGIGDTIGTDDPADRIFLFGSRATSLDPELPLVCDWRDGDLW